MDSRLFIEIGTDENGNLLPIDRTPYERWEIDVSNHTVIERLLDYNFDVVETRTKTITPDKDFNYLRNSKVFNLVYDGMYTYQKLIIPTFEHEGNSDCYYKDGSLYLDGEKVTFDDIWKVKVENNNIFWFDDTIFSIYNLAECFVLTEKNRLDKIFKNGCKITCSSNEFAANADFLAGALLVLRHLIKLNNYTEAQLILNRLQTCNGLCKDVRKSLKGCGCGED